MYALEHKTAGSRETLLYAPLIEILDNGALVRIFPTEITRRGASYDMPEYVGPASKPVWLSIDNTYQEMPKYRGDMLIAWREGDAFNIVRYYQKYDPHVAPQTKWQKFKTWAKL